MDSGGYMHLLGRRFARLALLVLASALACAWLAVSAQAAKPTIATDGATATGSTYAIVEGNGSPGGLATTVHADYALASDVWCTSHGVEGTPRETGPKSLGSGNIEISEIHVELSGLEPGSEYCTELVAENGEGTARGAQVYVSTPVPPTVKLESASQITASDATLEATIDPMGSEETTYEFFLEAPSCASDGVGHCEASGGVPIFKGSLPAGSGTQTVSIDIATVWHKLTADTIYGYRVVATRGIAANSGQLETFATPEEEVASTKKDTGSTGGGSSGSSGGSNPCSGWQMCGMGPYRPPIYAPPPGTGHGGNAHGKRHHKAKRVAGHKKHKHHKAKAPKKHRRHKTRSG